MGTSTSVRIYLEMCIPLCVYVFDRSHSISDYESLAVYWQQEGKWETWMSRATPKQTPHTSHATLLTMRYPAMSIAWPPVQPTPQRKGQRMHPLEKHSQSARHVEFVEASLTINCLKVETGEKEPRCGPQTHDLRSNAVPRYLSPITVYTVTAGRNTATTLGPAPQGPVRWCAQRTASMCTFKLCS